MKFDVLNRSCDVHRHCLLEASAGTGKTYSIENVLVRLLIEPAPQTKEPLTLEQILVVTFTRAATRDLKQRIRGNIERARAVLNQEGLQDIPDYLLAILEKGEEATLLSLKRLERALFAFDQAQIFTIHGFCSRMLRDYAFEGDLGLGMQGGDEGPSTSRQLAAMTDFLRTGLTADRWSPAQVEKLLSQHSHDINALLRKLLKAPNGHLRSSPLPPFRESVAHFQTVMAQLKAQNGFEGKKMLQDFQRLASLYKKVDDQSLEEGKTAERFAALFDKGEWSPDDLDDLIADDFFCARVLEASNLKKNRKPCPPEELHYPELGKILNQAFAALFPLSEGYLLFQKLVMESQSHFKRFQEEEELLSFDGLLRSMQRAVQNAAFVARVLVRYRVAIIDEFQDTDPIQWEIFKRLFLNSQDHRLYLVGDPKQSIYAFRQADIYTYLEAATALGAQHHAVLETNYRSQPGLVQALNHLFSLAEEWIPLPRLNSALVYRPVQAGKRAGLPFEDTLGSIHICFVEGPKTEIEKQCFFPYITSEIQRLKADYKADYDGWAILVESHYQGARLAQFLKQHGIPTVIQKQVLLADSPALPALKELLEGVLQPRQESAFKRALGGPLIGWTHEQLLALQEDHSRREQLLVTFIALREVLQRDALTGFFPAFLNSSFQLDGKTVAERLLSREEGVEIYDDLCQIVEWILIRQPSEPLSSGLKALEVEGKDEEQGIRRLQNPDSKGVKILTLHASKGLEFDIVFPLGLIHETKSSQDPQEWIEMDAEKMRQLYVAMTRAKSRLYLPVVFSEKESAPGKASPMQLFLKQIKIENAAALNDLKCETITVGRLQPGEAECQQLPESHESCSLILPSAAHLSRPAQFLSSYSSLLHQDREEYYPSFVTSRKIAEEKSVHTLPAGSQVGNLLHKLLEAVPLEEIRKAASPAEVVPLIHPHLKGDAFGAWHDVLAQIVFNAFHTPLPLLNGPTPLAATDPRRHFRETEFLFPWENQFVLDEVKHVPGFLKGVIDLLFEHAGRYYLLDWKSNRLGARGEDYQCHRMEEAMREGGYFLQAQVYIEALRRYLKLVDPGPFEERFGGILYIFLRGLDPAAASNQGVYHLWQV